MLRPHANTGEDKARSLPQFGPTAHPWPSAACSRLTRRSPAVMSIDSLPRQRFALSDFI
ncbi:hypothetical protein GWL_22010 [Herbaspirillum sp. GW103]|nr:hypothetical protein GWL_22010 [Herbaspirillum sp. GW103]